MAEGKVEGREAALRTEVLPRREYLLQWESVCIRKIRLISPDTKDKRLRIVSRLNSCTSSVKSTTTLVETSKDREMARTS